MDQRYSSILTRGFSEQSLQDVLDVVSTENVNTTDSKGRTATMLACFLDDILSVQILVNLGSDALIKDCDGKSALDYATNVGVGQFLMNNVLPVHDISGDVIYPFQNCLHPKENILLDFERFYIVCTHCAVILEDDLKLPVSKEERIELVEHLGIDNNTAYKLGIENSLGTKRKDAREWLKNRYKQRKENMKCTEDVTYYKKMSVHLKMPYHPMLDI
jgi:hypothetical protein